MERALGTNRIPTLLPWDSADGHCEKSAMGSMGAKVHLTPWLVGEESGRARRFVTDLGQFIRGDHLSYVIPAGTWRRWVHEIFYARACPSVRAEYARNESPEYPDEGRICESRCLDEMDLGYGFLGGGMEFEKSR